MFFSFLLAFLLLLFLVLLRISTPVYSLPLPPGPRTSWFQRSVTSLYPWVAYAKWKEIYGDLIYIRLLGNPILVLNSAQAIHDLLDKRGHIYSSRPIRPMVVDLIGWDWAFSTMAYGERWKRHRNLFHRHFRQSVPAYYQTIQIKEAHTFLRTLLDDPDSFRYLTRRAALAVVLNLIYGQRVAERGDEHVDVADTAIAGLTSAGIFGTYLVDYIPALRHVPIWFPFATFRRNALKWRELSRRMVEEPYKVAKEMLARVATPCFVTQELENMTLGLEAEEEETIKNVAATAYAGGSDTVVSIILSFFLVMTCYPEAQKLAQEEIDRVIGHDRLPILADRPCLPLIQSLCYELLRWNPVTPLGIAHYLMEDDEYNGYQIPKGTTIIPNVWAVLHDPEIYPDSMAFKIDRFLDVEGNALAGINEIPDAVFGFGRRTCPGRFIGLDFVWVVVASMLATYNISKAVDENGQLIEPEVEYTSILISHPKPFKCRITPRSENARLLIEQTKDTVI
ncbi:cytochrome P450 [Macrolepiota fuliginosa MF-IS2]|uniref:Cytochrome P450 n=1 Tax=Macrolepiota fuliginosa MF-IS2 TaxID=1400762 RepID=A0A9P5XMZ8_9AGAR|nr:cytochrome P450 [Macrolepiota fuliginosa MF-IS2]